MLDRDTLRALSGNSQDPGRYHFDLSKINKQENRPFFNTLQKFAIKNIVSLGFSAEELKKAESKAVAGNALPPEVSNSIAVAHKKTYIKNIVTLIQYLLKEGRITNIHEIVLNALPLTQDQITELAISYSTSNLESIVFQNIPLGDGGLNTILAYLDPNRIKAVTFHRCNLSPAATSKILTFISKRTSDQGIKEFNVSKVEFSQEDRNRIAEALKNQGQADAPTNDSQRKASPSKSSPRKSSPKKKQPTLSPEGQELQKLREENAALREQLKNLRDTVDAVQYNENVFVVGKGAEEFIKFLNTVESKIAKLEEKKSFNDI
ncbi:hypothetical protein TVAG_117380 [Trichomonas vaginalis G3]|uniref:Uncharacterized protein n=1 Tax=Trichomonas vaginalis (strain ATCC PRA-98 / G3) TaxID=412133 RepID=A2E3S8_TRIV3|nr:ribonuclease inhibitor domain-containing protein [Trichomonas vaginalis G3]EAY12716.1 hypothetical protein TVAG_117380 [Trichomonas vaginalis G3]KAI5517522.1 ribonuclease inhibitor domain-containing protein [Trichomonas vaginalis G3]|eukprot:XP_001324939.1 hypothetical protein [Trichomonas vaginalis G3]